jgi:hypothetical protein
MSFDTAITELRWLPSSRRSLLEEDELKTTGLVLLYLLGAVYPCQPCHYFKHWMPRTRSHKNVYEADSDCDSKVLVGIRTYHRHDDFGEDSPMDLKRSVRQGWTSFALAAE